MMRGTYRGPKTHLYNQHALIRPIVGDTKYVLAQFDAKHLHESFGWHKLPLNDFIAIETSKGKTQ